MRLRDRSSVVGHVVVAVAAGGDIEAWEAELAAVAGGLGWLFARPEPKETFGLLVRAMLSDAVKKNCWGMSEHVGLGTPKRFQHLLNSASWDADALRDWLRGYVLGGLADPAGALVLDDTQAVKKGRMSVGVAPQHCDATGQTENCQCMVMLSYASTHGHAYIDREIFLPSSWTRDRARCAVAGVPAGRGPASKPQLGVVMLARALADEALVFGWVVAGSAYGQDPVLRGYCHQRRLSYVVGVPADLPLVGVRGEASRPDEVAATVVGDAWRRRSDGDGTGWDFATRDVTVKGRPPADGFAHTLLIRKATRLTVDRAHPGGFYEVSYFLVHAPAGTPLPAMTAAAGLLRGVADDHKGGRNLLGLDRYQVRKWTPLYRHVTTSMLAHAFLAVTGADQGRADQGRADPGRADPGRADPGRADPGRADQGRADPGEGSGPTA